MATETTTIAVVEDDAGVRTALGQLLRAADFNALTFGSAEEFLASGLRASVDCLIADINLPGMSGVALLKALAASGPVPPALLITARDDAATLEMIRQAAPVRHLRKPFGDEELFQAIEHARLG
ncbi:MAG TPA: response regulator [Gemmatimonadaceae bacterium]|nr:response regulator [Gemmatimonadaceae bacterium]